MSKKRESEDKAKNIYKTDKNSSLTNSDNTKQSLDKNKGQ